MECVKVSLAFMPCERMNAKIKGVKEFLKSLVGWYASCNSAGHITICEFEAEKDELDDIVATLVDKLQYEHAQFVYFNDYSMFQHGETYTYYIKPTVQSKFYLNQRSEVIISTLKNRFSLKAISKEPHLTIGRRLEIDKIIQAKDHLKKVDLDFFCDSVFIRIFNPALKQYDIYSKISFGGKERLFDVGQLSLDF